ncbi:MAG: prephenate dehydrogenase/arogenate dehydrogenase family protein [Candidatus Bathyarchaeia archaeon]
MSDKAALKTVTILGGTGKMGRWFAQQLLKKGHRVILHGRSPEKTAAVARGVGAQSVATLQDAVSEADVVMVATPIRSTEVAVREAARHARQGILIFDVASVKSNIPQALEEAAAHGLNAVSVHPMFGPGAASLQGRRIIIIPVRENTRAIHMVKELFAGEGAVFHELPNGKVHDEIMALVLSLPHFLNIAFGAVIASRDVNTLKEFAGTTFAMQLLLSQSVLSEDPALYSEIQTENPAFKSILQQLVDAVTRLRNAVNSSDSAGFREIFEGALERLRKDPDFPKAYSRLYKALEASASTEA